MKGIIKVAALSPKIRLADTEYNADICVEAAMRAAASGAELAVFPELVLTGATAGDLYFSEVLCDGALAALERFAAQTSELSLISFIGLPLRAGGALYNAVAAVSFGEIIGISASDEHSRHFTAALCELEADILGKTVKISNNALYSCAKGSTRVNVFVKIGLGTTPVPVDADIIVNPAAEPEYIGLRSKRNERLIRESALFNAAYIYCGASEGESGTDGIYASPRVILNNGAPVCESELFDGDILTAELDLDAPAAPVAELKPEEPSRLPFIPDDKRELDLALTLQARALAHRMERAYIRTCVLGVSGGLDSTLAVLVAARAMDILKKPRTDVIAITMPCFGTSERTKSNALALAEELGCTVKTIDIKAAVTTHFADIGHAKDDYSVVYENAQARERTQILMDVANATGGLVVGTGDLSELALGFATYGGDHLSMYGVNASVPKTLMRAMIARCAELAKEGGSGSLASILTDVIETPVSPELLPTKDGEENKQHTEKIVGPYELHDFFLYHTVKFGRSPKKIAQLAKQVFGEAYTEDEIKGYLGIFISRFFSQQFKRSCMPDGPRVTEISLSPRGAWQMPSDCSAVLFKNSLR